MENIMSSEKSHQNMNDIDLSGFLNLQPNSHYQSKEVVKPVPTRTAPPPPPVMTKLPRPPLAHSKAVATPLAAISEDRNGLEAPNHEKLVRSSMVSSMSFDEPGPVLSPTYSESRLSFEFNSLKIFEEPDSSDKSDIRSAPKHDDFDLVDFKVRDTTADNSLKSPTSEQNNQSSWFGRFRFSVRHKPDQADGIVEKLKAQEFDQDQCFRCKLFGSIEIVGNKGDKICQTALQELKKMIRLSGQHKQKVQVRVSSKGIKINDEKTEETIFNHSITIISFIAPDPWDSRAFGYIVSEKSKHTFYGIRTERAASEIMICLRDIFTSTAKGTSSVKKESKIIEEEELDSGSVKETKLPTQDFMADLWDIQLTPKPVEDTQITDTSNQPKMDTDQALKSSFFIGVTSNPISVDSDDQQFDTKITGLKSLSQPKFDEIFKTDESNSFVPIEDFGFPSSSIEKPLASDLGTGAENNIYSLAFQDLSYSSDFKELDFLSDQTKSINLEQSVSSQSLFSNQNPEFSSMEQSNNAFGNWDATDPNPVSSRMTSNFGFLGIEDIFRDPFSTKTNTDSNFFQDLDQQRLDHSNDRAFEQSFDQIYPQMENVFGEHLLFEDKTITEEPFTLQGVEENESSSDFLFGDPSSTSFYSEPKNTLSGFTDSNAYFGFDDQWNDQQGSNLTKDVSSDDAFSNLKTSSSKRKERFGSLTNIFDLDKPWSSYLDKEDSRPQETPEADNQPSLDQNPIENITHFNSSTFESPSFDLATFSSRSNFDHNPVNEATQIQGFDQTADSFSEVSREPSQTKLVDGLGTTIQSHDEMEKKDLQKQSATNAQQSEVSEPKSILDDLKVASGENLQQSSSYDFLQDLDPFGGNSQVVAEMANRGQTDYFINSSTGNQHPQQGSSWFDLDQLKNF